LNENARLIFSNEEEEGGHMQQSQTEFNEMIANQAVKLF
jgi:hypothetical protein